MNILSIGNSFSQNAHKYIHELARANGVQVTAINLYIGGCSLERHYNNMLTGSDDYGLMINSYRIKNTDLEYALKSFQFDAITLQQVSGLGRDYTTFEPFLTELVEYVKKYQPRAKLYLHETWGYKPGAPTLMERGGYATHNDMYRDVKRGYELAYENHPEFSGVIHSGRAVEKAVNAGLPNMFSDNIHLGSTGEYLIGLVWLRTLLGQQIEAKTDLYLEKPISEKEFEIIDEIARDI